MPNKLRKVFSNNPYSLKNTVRFKDAESSKKFGEALKQVYNDGRPVEVDGIEAIFTDIQMGDSKYPIMIEESVDRFIVAPAEKPVSIKINSKSGAKDITLYKSELQGRTRIRNSGDSAISLNFEYSADQKSMTVSFRMHIENAKSAKTVSADLFDAAGVLNFFFSVDKMKSDDDEKLKYNRMLNAILYTADVFDKLSSIEDVLGETFVPKEIGNVDDIARDVYELYVLLIKKEPVRLNAKLTSTTSTGITIEDDLFEHEIGAEIDLTFRNINSYSIGGKEFPIYTANLLTNAVIKEICREKDGAVRLLYGDTGSKPMYISYTGFKTEQECETELKNVLNHRPLYTEAQTVDKFIADREAELLS